MTNLTANKKPIVFERARDHADTLRNHPLPGGAFFSLATTLLAFLMVGWSLESRGADEDRPWEFSPYKVRSLVYMDDAAELNDELFERIAAEANTYARLLDSSGWKLTFEKATGEFRIAISRGVDNIELTDEWKQRDDVRQGDRLGFVSIEKLATKYVVTARQLDCQLHLWGPSSSRETIYPDVLPRLVFEVLKETLVPVAVVEKVEGKFVRLRIRAQQIMKTINSAGEVVANTQSPGWVDLNTVFRPVERKVDKDGNIALKNGIRIIDWTYFNPVEVVRSEYVEDESYLKAEVHSALRSPLAGRTSRSKKKFAVVTRPTGTKTRLTLLTKDKTPKPIPDKKVYIKYPHEKRANRVLGRTDRKGEIVIDQNNEPLHIVYIRSGERRVLARLPIIPGYSGVVTANMLDDKDRLRSEGILAGFEFRFMDLSVRRQVFALRIRSKLEKGKADEARRLYNDFFTKLETRDDFIKSVVATKRRLKSDAGDERQAELIDNMFTQFQVLVQEKMNANLSALLDQQILNVENGGTYKPQNSNLDTSKLDKDLEDAQKDAKSKS